MIVSTIPIVHKTKHSEPIFTIHRCENKIATGSMNGEMKLWTSEGLLIATLKKHSGSVASVRFSPGGKMIASAGDDGWMQVLSVAECSAGDCQPLYRVKHQSDVTNVEWAGEFLLSVDLDGVLIVSRIGNKAADTPWSEARRIKDHEGPITGLCVSPDARWVCTYSEGTLILYKDLVFAQRLDIEKGLIMESLNSRLSFAPNSQLLSIGLQFNNKAPSVDIFDCALNRAYSLMGHVAPSEITSFCPLAFRPTIEDGALRIPSNTEAREKYFILAVASQDLSLSFWSTANPRPFLLIKNFTEAPVLDMCWDGTVLYASSYDGVVRRVSFGKGELGEVTAEVDEQDDFPLPFSRKSMELTEKRKCQPKGDMKIEPFKTNTLEGFQIILNGDKVKEFSQKEKNELPVVSGEKELSETTPAIPPSIPLAIPPSIIPMADQPKRIQPRMLDQPARPVVRMANAEGGIVLFDTNIPEKLKLTYTQPFRTTVGIFTIELNCASTKVSVFRDDKLFYTVTGLINKVAYNNQYLVVYTTHVQIYNLKTGTLHLPYILIKLTMLSLFDHKLLLLNCYGDISIINLRTLKSHNVKLPKTKGLTDVFLDKVYSVVAKYKEETVYYKRSLGVWLALNPEFNSIYTLGTDAYNDVDETLSYIECQYRNYVLTGDQRGIELVAKQLFGIVRRMGKLSSVLEYKLDDVFERCRSRKFIARLLQEMNEEGFLRYFVEKKCEKYMI